METFYFEIVDYHIWSTVVFTIGVLGWLALSSAILWEKFVVGAVGFLILIASLIVSFAIIHSMNLDKEEHIKELLNVEVIDLRDPGLVKYGHNERALITNLGDGKYKLEVLP